MRIHNIGLFLYSSLAIVALTLVWGWQQVPKQGALAEEQLRVSLEQEVSVVRGAVRAATELLKVRTLDVLRGEGAAAKQALAASPLVAAALLDTDQAQWKVSHLTTNRPKDFTAAQLKAWVTSWPLDTLSAEQVYFTKVGEYDGRVHFAVAIKVRREGASSAIAVGVVPAAEFPLSLSSERARDVSVFDASGNALALNHSAYVGANIRRQPLVSEMLESDVVNVRSEWTGEKGVPMLGLATRVADSNLFVAVEAKTPLSIAHVRRAWIYLALGALGAIALNWALFTGQVRPLLRQLEGAESQVETLRRLMSEAPKVSAPALEDRPLTASELPQMDFVEPAAAVTTAAAGATANELPMPATSLAKIVDLALRSLEPKLRELEVTVDRVGLINVMVTNDILQLQTAFEEVLKNAVDSLAQVDDRRLTIEAHEQDGRLSVRVVDTGTGVVGENLPRIFEAFYTTRPQSSGIARGLGLNVVRRIIEEIGGSVVARNTADREGFAVELTWPREPRRFAAPERTAPPPRAVTTAAAADLSASPGLRASIDDLVRRPRVRTLD